MSGNSDKNPDASAIFNLNAANLADNAPLVQNEICPLPTCFPERNDKVFPIAKPTVVCFHPLDLDYEAEYPAEKITWREFLNEFRGRFIDNCTDFLIVYTVVYIIYLISSGNIWKKLGF